MTRSLCGGERVKAIDAPGLNWDTDICNCSPLLQLAFGITNLTANPELLPICAFANRLGITPNITCHGKDDVSDGFLKGLCNMCGAVSVSKYDKDRTYRLHRAPALRRGEADQHARPCRGGDVRRHPAHVR